MIYLGYLEIDWTKRVDHPEKENHFFPLLQPMLLVVGA